MDASLEKLLRAATKVSMTDSEREEQRISFSYGSAKIENDRITEQMVREAAELIRAEPKAEHG